MLWHTAGAAPLEYRLGVDGPACPFCAYGIEKSLSKQEGVKRVETDIQAGQRVQRRQKGLGDLGLFGRYTIFQQDQPGRTFRLAPFAGIEAPTGEDEAGDALRRLPPPCSWVAAPGISSVAWC
ncbi:heavy metal-associated domain-containing protein [Zobellella aerophila]|uniref:HMA domain-containing protein n=1 Tax=Zobellella aerophila TaxID=870480 RepID=A0ABP6VHL7_9GAMM